MSKKLKINELYVTKFNSGAKVSLFYRTKKFYFDFRKIN
jgi:hypothetical protein